MARTTLGPTGEQWGLLGPLVGPEGPTWFVGGVVFLGLEGG